MSVSSGIRDFVEEVCGKTQLEIGKVVTHKDGRKVKIIEGYYWGTYGVSNFWRWQEVKSDGTFGEIECGYGWM